MAGEQDGTGHVTTGEVMTLTYTASFTDEPGVLNFFSDTIDCGGRYTEIVSVSTSTGEDSAAVVDIFTHLILTVQDGIGDDDQHDATFHFNKDGSVVKVDGSYPAFSDANLLVHGRLSVTDLTVAIEYRSVPGTVCTVG